jgi:hypothetical protein
MADAVTHGRRFRERRLDFSKQMPVVKTQKDLVMADDGQLMPKKRDEDELGGMGLMLDDDEGDVSAREDFC